MSRKQGPHLLLMGMRPAAIGACRRQESSNVTAVIKEAAA
jgi:hypothetical protein